MFDNSTNPPAGAVPNNLPTGEPEDMFSGAHETGLLPESALPPISTSPSAEPMVLPPTALDAGVLRPKLRTEPMVEMPTLPPMPVNSPNSDGVLSAPLGGHKALITAIVLLSVIIVGGGSAWAYFTYINPPETQVLPNTAIIIPTTTPILNPPIFNNTPTTTESELGTDATSTDNRILFGEPVLDTDSDGLDDSVEKEIGTNMLAWDSDGDTLSDGDEVLTWKTDPLKADTDGDTYEDAAEIKNGYNPRGDGKLFTINTTATSTFTTSTAELKP